MLMKYSLPEYFITPTAAANTTKTADRDILCSHVSLHRGILSHPILVELVWFNNRE